MVFLRFCKACSKVMRTGSVVVSPKAYLPHPKIDVPMVVFIPLISVVAAVIEEHRTI